MSATSLWLPGPLQRRIDRASSRLLPSGPQWNFSEPAGEAALVPPDSISWRVFKNPVALFIGGVGAVVLELAEPSVRDGVWQHSSFRTDALTRLQRTGLAAMMTVYGPRSRAETMIAHVVRAHGKVVGETSEGTPYEANDPVLLDWVQATASFGFMHAYHRYARALSPAERDAFLAEAEPSARLYGATDAPRSEAELAALFDRMDSRLVPSPIIVEFLDIMRTVPALPAALRPVQHLLVRAAVDMLPSALIERLGLHGWRLKAWQRPLVRAAGAAADRLLLPSSPPVQASLRLGLPAKYLYRRA